VQQLTPLDRGHCGPPARRLTSGRDRGIDLLAGGQRNLRERLLGRRVLDCKKGVRPRDLLASDQEAGLELAHAALLNITCLTWV
jgi:hypothetical protein